MCRVVPKQRFHLFCCGLTFCLRVFVLVTLLGSGLHGAGPGEGSSLVQGVVLDSMGRPVSGAQVFVLTPHGAVLDAANTHDDGVFKVRSPHSGSVRLRFVARGFEPVERSNSGGEATGIRVVLSPTRVTSQITVTASRGLVEEAEASPHVVSVRELRRMEYQPLPTVAHALEGSPGVLIQQTTVGQVSPFLRGLTGNQVLHLIDGIRLNNSTFRYGPNQYLALAEPSRVERVEAVLGPAASQYGSDALGGAVNVISAPPLFGEGPGAALHGEMSVSGATADLSGGAAGKLSVSTGRLFWTGGVAARHHNDLRAGGGVDSRNVFRRYLGLDSSLVRDMVGNRLPETAYSRSGLESKLAIRLPSSQNLTIQYQRSALDGVRAYKNLLGGLGKLQAGIDPQGLDFFYARYEKSGFHFLDSITGTFSINSQKDGSVSQGLQFDDVVTRDRTRVDAFGYSGQATAHSGRHAFVFGTDIYQEAIDSWRIEQDPATGESAELRSVFPNGSNYLIAGLFAQDMVELIPGRLRATAGGRFTHAGFRTYAARNVDHLGNSLGVIDSSQVFRDATFNTSLSWQITPYLAWHALAGRGFRAPNANDLGAVGLNDLGYEAPASEVAPLGALVGNSSGESAVSSGRAVRGLVSERLLNYETGLTWRGNRSSWRLQMFDAEIYDPIVRRTLLFPVDAVPSMILGKAVTPLVQTDAQRAQGTVTVATELDSRALKAFVNDGRQRYWGIETAGNWRVSPAWMLESQYSFLVGRELLPNRAVRRLPPQQGSVIVRHVPGASRFWWQAEVRFVGAQSRLSGGDLSDERIGAQRDRGDIADFFAGARMSPHLSAGADGARGTADDVFRLSGETLRRIQDRVLPLGSTINGVLVSSDSAGVPLFPRTAGYVTFNVTAGIRLSETTSLSAGIGNLCDRNYRVHGSGIDGPGRDLWVRYRYVF
ncbi:MAG: TonB-dependent receptor [Bryobacteraceae bacterium]